jgi:hypothetical protein
MSNPTTAIVSSRPLNLRTPQGGYTSSHIKGFLNYVAYGQQRLRQEMSPRGIWFDEHGATQAHPNILQWAKQQSLSRDYEVAYQLLLSTRAGGLSAADFNRAIQAGGQIVATDSWRLMRHEDTNNQHAHVVLFQKESLKPSQYRAWHKEMQMELTRLQKENQQQQGWEIKEKTQSMSRGLSL